MKDTSRELLIERVVQFARDNYVEGANDDVQIDGVPEYSEVEGGFWVAAWVWVPKSEVE